VPPNPRWQSTPARKQHNPVREQALKRQAEGSDCRHAHKAPPHSRYRRLVVITSIQTMILSGVADSATFPKALRVLYDYFITSFMRCSSEGKHNAKTEVLDCNDMLCRSWKAVLGIAFEGLFLPR